MSRSPGFRGRLLLSRCAEVAGLTHPSSLGCPVDAMHTGSSVVYHPKQSLVAKTVTQLTCVPFSSGLMLINTSFSERRRFCVCACVCSRTWTNTYVWVRMWYMKARGQYQGPPQSFLIFNCVLSIFHVCMWSRGDMYADQGTVCRS